MFSSEKVTRDWQEYVADMTMSPYKDMLGLRLDLIGAPDMTLWYDNIRVYELDDAGQERLIWRMSFDEPLITQDSALNTRAYWMKFDAFRLNKPVVRGETGLPPDNTGFDRHEDPNLTADQLRVFHHKRIWAHLGSPGFYDGYLWWPRIEAHNLWPLWGAYERFMTGEPVSNGKYTEIGSDLEGLRQVNVTGGVRAWGLRDAAAGKVLLWIDNPDQTFRNLNPGSRSGTVSTGGWANGTYTVEWWDTSKGVKVSSYDTQVQNGVLALSFSGLQGDVAAKIYPAAVAPTPPPTAPTPPPTAPETGTGLRAEYFGWYDWDTQTYSRPVFVRTDATINFNWGLGSPGTGIGSDKFAVVWTGKVLPRYSETYSFTSTTDDGVRVWVNGKLIIDQWGHSRPGRTFSGNIALTAGQKYDIKMEYYEDSVDAVARLEWQSPSQAREVVPQSQLFPQ
jgi:mannan endo-1,4-beta-mannosidase